MDAFRNFCLQPGIEGKQLFAQISGFQAVNEPFCVLMPEGKLAGLQASRIMLLGIQSLMKKHFEIRLVPQPFLGGQNSRSREVIFR